MLSVGVWLSLVEHLHGVQGVASSNPATPTRVLSGWTACAALLLAGCGGATSDLPSYGSAEEEAELRKQVKLAMDRRLQHHQRVQRVGARIKLANAELCEDFREAHYGFEMWSLPLLGKLRDIDREVYEEAYGLGEEPQVMTVYPDTVAERAGIQVGDKVLEIDGEPVPTSNRRYQRLVDSLLANTELEPVDFKLQRGDRIIDLDLRPQPACRSGVFLDSSMEINASADGEDIVIAKGLLYFTENDEELAFIIGHELAHNVMRHIDTTRSNMIIAGALGAVLDAAAGASGIYTGGAISSSAMQLGYLAKSTELEAEADYIGLYMLHTAGYDIGNSADFWRRMGAEGGQLYTSRTHPTTPQRFIVMQKTIDEIQGKAARGEPVVPTPRDDT